MCNVQIHFLLWCDDALVICWSVCNKGTLAGIYSHVGREACLISRDCRNFSSYLCGVVAEQRVCSSWNLGNESVAFHYFLFLFMCLSLGVWFSPDKVFDISGLEEKASALQKDRPRFRFNSAAHWSHLAVRLGILLNTFNFCISTPKEGNTNQFLRALLMKDLVFYI